MHAPPLARRFPEMTLPMMQRYHPRPSRGSTRSPASATAAGRYVVMKAAEQGAPVAATARGRPLLRGRARGRRARRGACAACRARRLLRDLRGGVHPRRAAIAAHRLSTRAFTTRSASTSRAACPCRPSLRRHARPRPGRAPTRPFDSPSGRPGPRAFCNSFGLTAARRGQAPVGQHRRARTPSSWRAWLRDRHGCVIDAVADGDDPGPMAVEVARQLLSYVRHPRAFVRTIALDP